MKSSVGLASTTITSQNVNQSTDGNQADASEIETLTGLSGDLEKKLEDLQQFVLQPKSIIFEVLKMVSAAKAGQNSIINSIEFFTDGYKREQWRLTVHKMDRKWTGF
ncbi:hypothetical protein GIB67_005345 [Kingdonia uniflora]|uniref:Uncharacterized protein n=1 Tax=Kingdonia uniflora TaxID=39325 RepID=A0A7J7NCS7_9MAGN|nr:hypothetical protein GIB67_005345 [Kingdonia uniflora]